MSTKYNTEEIWNLISKRWNLRILKELGTKTVTRFNELKQSISGISANVLSERLDNLEKLGLVKRIRTNDTTSHSGYILTEGCENLKRILLELDDWISSYQLNKPAIIDMNNAIPSQKLLEFLKQEITETEYNFIKDKLLFSFGTNSLDLIINFNTLKNILFELYGDELGNKIVEKLNEQIKSFKINV